MTVSRGLRLMRGDGAVVWDEDDNSYLDFDCSQGAVLLGHNQQAVNEAIDRELRLLSAVHHSYDTDARDELIEALSLLAPEPLSHAVIVSSGKEAIDAAVMGARIVTRRRRVVTAVHSRGGVANGDCLSIAYGDGDALRAVLDESVACVVVEPIFGDAGVVLPPGEYLPYVAHECRRRGALLVVDESQTALRTGMLLSSAKYDFVPDMLCLSRSLANGLPIGVVITTQDVARQLRARPGWYDSAECANPVICAAATATLRIATNPSLQVHVAAVGEYLLQRLRALRISEIREVRGEGLMLGIELRHGAAPVVRALQKRGVLVIPGINGMIRLMPPLILERRQADTAVEALAAAIREARRPGQTPESDDEITLPGIPSRIRRPSNHS
jgi:acetylornithine/LysW-gamma-L-lysine aminotransferase